MRQRACDRKQRTMRRRRRSRRGALAQPLILSPTKIYKSAYRAKLARFFRRSPRRHAIFVYKNLQKYICVRARVNFGGAGLPHAIRQPETARRQKKSGVLELFPYRASGPFPTLFYCLSDRVPTDVPIALPILARFRPIDSPILTPPGQRSIPLPGGPTSAAPIQGCQIGSDS